MYTLTQVSTEQAKGIYSEKVAKASKTQRVLLGLKRRSEWNFFDCIVPSSLFYFSTTDYFLFEYSFLSMLTSVRFLSQKMLSFCQSCVCVCMCVCRWPSSREREWGSTAFVVARFFIDREKHPLTYTYMYSVQYTLYCIACLLCSDTLVTLFSQCVASSRALRTS